MIVMAFPIINLGFQIHAINRYIGKNTLVIEDVLGWLNQYGEIIQHPKSSTFAYKSSFGFQSLHYFTNENGQIKIMQHSWI